MLFLLLALFSQGASIQTQFDNAVAALKASDLPKAEAGFKTILESQPNNVGALANLGVVYSQMNQPAEAITIYNRALKLKPGDPRLLMNLGLAHLKFDEHDTAKPLFAEALSKSPGSVQIRELLATTQVYTGEAKEALVNLSKLWDSSSVLYLRMLAQLKLDQKQEAQATSATLFARLGAAEAHFLSGRAYYESALFDEAVKSLEQAAKSKPTLLGLQRELGKAYVSIRNSSDARKHLQAALQQNPYDQEAAYFLGALLVQEDALADGVGYLRQSEKIRPNFWGVHYYLGRAFLQQGETAAALKHFERAASLNPEEPSIYFQLSRALKIAGRDDESRKAADRLRELRAKMAGKERETLVLK
jgi:protein O-GlcNAc transferase